MSLPLTCPSSSRASLWNIVVPGAHFEIVSKRKQNHTARHSDSWGFPRLVSLFLLWETPQPLVKKLDGSCFWAQHLVYFRVTHCSGNRTWNTPLSTWEAIFNYTPERTVPSGARVNAGCHGTALNYVCADTLSHAVPVHGGHVYLFPLFVAWCLSSAPGIEIYERESKCMWSPHLLPK